MFCFSVSNNLLAYLQTPQTLREHPGADRHTHSQRGSIHLQRLGDFQLVQKGFQVYGHTVSYKDKARGKAR